MNELPATLKKTWASVNVAVREFERAVSLGYAVSLVTHDGKVFELEATRT